jgi:5-methyltetrahydrofolate--homocysteine methyltransferase
MLDRMCEEKLPTAGGTVGFFPAASTADDSIIVYRGENRGKELIRIPTLRQQRKKENTPHYYALSDFIAPEDSGIEDYLGFFAVTAGRGLEKITGPCIAAGDDYSSIMAKILADRLAEAFAEKLHEMVRKDLWGYAPDENLTLEELLAVKYRGIRPAPGYPPCPDHYDKKQYFPLIEAEARAGISLTESYMMVPGASVSGFIFAHPQSCYYSVGKILEDQAEDYARRCGISLKEAERRLSSVLAYK